MVCGQDAASFKIMNAGRTVQEWIGLDIRGRNISDLPPDCSLAITDAVSQALNVKEPVFATSHRIRDGVVVSYEILALPMSYRWGRRS